MARADPIPPAMECVRGCLAMLVPSLSTLTPYKFPCSIVGHMMPVFGLLKRFPSVSKAILRSLKPKSTIDFETKPMVSI